MSSAAQDDPGLGRRQLLARCFWAAVSLVTAGIAAPLLGYFVGPLLRRRTPVRVPLGAVADFPTDRPQKVEFVLRRRDGWVTEEGRHAAWVVRRGADVLVFDPRCTHLGCAYHWHTETSQFLCPCHNGLYDLEGRVVGGPPPRPLDTYAVTVEAGVLAVVPTPQRRT
jgi:menaquinol-cytochrome c reductase iron-sulfur subunit